MLGTTLDTAIGLIFVFLLVSLVCSAIQESLELLLKQRAGYLRGGLLRLLGAQALTVQRPDFPLAPPVPGPGGVGAAAGGNAQTAVGTEDVNRQAAARAARAARAAYYLAPDKAEAAQKKAVAVIQALPAAAQGLGATSAAGQEAEKAAKEAEDAVAQQRALAVEWVEKLYAHPLIRALCRADETYPSYIPSDVFVRALTDLVRTEAHLASKSPTDPAQLVAPAPQIATVTAFREAAGMVPNLAVRTALLSLSDLAGDRLEELQRLLAAWFDGTMDRVAGWYKRWTQRWLLLIAAALTLLVNIDAVAIGRTLAQSQAIRDNVIKEVKAQVDKAGPVAIAPPATPGPLTLPTATTTTTAPATATTTTVSTPATTPPPGGIGAATGSGTGMTPATTSVGPPAFPPLQKAGPIAAVTTTAGATPTGPSDVNLKSAAARISEIGVPIGWDPTDDRSVPWWRNGREDGDRHFNWPLKLAGWLLTILAVSLGAPFWFDVLNKFMVVRKTIKPQEKSRPEGPK
jgi:hypothetical protein